MLGMLRDLQHERQIKNDIHYSPFVTSMNSVQTLNLACPETSRRIEGLLDNLLNGF